MGTEIHAFGDASLRAAVSVRGAELVSLTRDDGTDLLWDAGPEWRRQSPVLFPIVGRLPDDTATIDGTRYHLTQHGFARDRVFRLLETSDNGCVLELHEDDASLAVFPFRFRLWIAYTVADGELTVRYTLRNPDDRRVLHASLGAHPAFRWPLHEGDVREEYRLIFEEAEPEPVRRVSGGLLAAAAYPTPVRGRELLLDDSLFVDDAVIFDRIRSRSVVFGRPGASGLRVSWQGFPELGVWTKPGAPFLCIEPWHGLATPQGFSGEFRDKPGLVHLQSGQEWEAHWSVKVVDV
ncbi:aldose 1-epimerase family protein [Acetobacter fallax]|uniref:Aldose 1-epimerase family protein n=1 Tax=Acetobacter fallax TaxID=1737473 RepID=A0ABX0KC16_9PROT|nr:aldose 1-epimerase family protein [Acetobacter fallax]NHO32984.1 aldose 1-epimerase family protein [Acetobacter fallax]NHO36647.1 aldose 1-epimerase family protein [Acetobacter fallax]